MIENNTDLLHIYDQPLYVFPDKAPNVISNEAVDASILVMAKRDDLNETTSDLLAKMLKACQLETNATQIIGVDDEDIIQMIQSGKWQFVLLFGLELHNESFYAKKEKYKPFRFGGRAFLYAESLKLIANSPASKSALWTQGLKPLFNLT